MDQSSRPHDARRARETDSVRARDVDRVEACGLLDAALEDGQLTAAEHSERTASAMKAEFVEALRALIGDLQLPGESAEAATSSEPTRWPRWVRRTIGVVVVVLAASVLGVVVRQVGAHPDAPISALVQAQVPNLTEGRGIGEFVQRYREKFGDTEAVDVTFFPEYAVVTQGDPAQRYRYDGEFTTSGSAGTTDKRPIDLADLDLDTLSRVLAGAPSSMGLAGGSISHLVLASPPQVLGTQPIITLFAEGAGGKTGMMMVAFDGSLIRLDQPS
ncbi:DUF1707 SHOCT-like domain-containing protein [Nocardia callitridis]|uniref:DUF1707 domain-containing protein n=1 Tax=Nocardia callitridis TaxID=648753 RepID=A0ABP9JZL8_9NOCA